MAVLANIADGRSFWTHIIQSDEPRSGCEFGNQAMGWEFNAYRNQLCG